MILPSAWGAAGFKMSMGLYFASSVLEPPTKITEKKNRSAEFTVGLAINYMKYDDSTYLMFDSPIRGIFCPKTKERIAIWSAMFTDGRVDFSEEAAKIKGKLRNIPFFKDICFYLPKWQRL